MYRLYLNNIRFPIAPEKVSLKIKNKNKTLDLINGGEINLLKSPGLTEVSFDVLLPTVQYPFARYTDGFKKPSYYLNNLELFKNNKSRVEFVLMRYNDTVIQDQLDEDTILTVAIEDYEIVDDVKDAPDIVVSIKLKQAPQYGTSIITLSKDNDNNVQATVETARETTKEIASTYTIKQGDNLWSIARTQLGDETKHTFLYENNKDIIEAAAKKAGKESSSFGRWIYPGTVLNLT